MPSSNLMISEKENLRKSNPTCLICVEKGNFRGWNPIHFIRMPYADLNLLCGTKCLIFYSMYAKSFKLLVPFKKKVSLYENLKKENEEREKLYFALKLYQKKYFSAEVHPCESFLC